MVLKSKSISLKDEEQYKVKNLYIGILNFMDIDSVTGRKIHLEDSSYSAFYKEDQDYSYRIISRSKKDNHNKPLTSSIVREKVLPLKEDIFVDSLEPMSLYTDEYKISRKEIHTILLNKNKGQKVKTFYRN